MIEVALEGMSCENCARHVREALTRLPGVASVTVDLARGRAKVEAGAEVADEAIIHALDEEGYPVTRIARD